jgi:magnesium transporter
MSGHGLPNADGGNELSARPAAIKTVACVGGLSIERGIPTEEVHDYIRDADNLIWMDVQDPTEEELSMLLEEFGFHPLSVEDVAKGEQRPKVDEYKAYLFVVTYGVAAGADIKNLLIAEVDLFIGRNYLVTVHRGRVPALEEAYQRWTRGGELLAEGVGFLTYTVVDALIDAYFPLIDAIEEYMDETELEMFSDSARKGPQELLKLKRTLVSLRRVLTPLREVFHVFLRRERPMFSPNTRIYFQDVHDHVLRILDVLEIEREMVTSSLEAYLTVLSNRLNATMQTLTVITMVVAVVGAVFGAWGMNFVQIPLSNTVWGFWMISGGTLLFVLLALGLARMRNWL